MKLNMKCINIENIFYVFILVKSNYIESILFPIDCSYYSSIYFKLQRSYSTNAYDFRNRDTKYLRTELTKFVHQNGEFDEKSLRPHGDSGARNMLRRLAEHPTVPMTSGPGNYQKFKINKVSHPGCKLSANTYNVFKDRYDSDDFWYTAHLGNKLRPNKDPEMEHDELGYINCSPGWIEMVEIHDEEGPTNARKCGISTVLTELCFIDPEINYLYHPRTKQESNAIKKLQQYPEELNQIKDNCKQLVGLRMAATNKEGAYAYFSAAERMNYGQILVQIKEGKEAHFHKFFTKDAKSQYDKNTGHIDMRGEFCHKSCQGTTCKAYEEIWYFCKQK